MTAYLFLLGMLIIIAVSAVYREYLLVRRKNGKYRLRLRPFADLLCCCCKLSAVRSDSVFQEKHEEVLSSPLTLPLGNPLAWGYQTDRRS